MLFLLVGRTGVGKSHLEQLLETHFHWRFIRSYTDRPKRGPKDTGHTFLSTEKLASFPKEERVAETIIGPYTYFATKEQVAQADGYVIDPNGRNWDFLVPSFSLKLFWQASVILTFLDPSAFVKILGSSVSLPVPIP